MLVSAAHLLFTDTDGPRSARPPRHRAGRVRGPRQRRRVTGRPLRCSSCRVGSGPILLPSPASAAQLVRMTSCWVARVIAT
jgi:hypothetical protein